MQLMIKERLLVIALSGDGIFAISSFERLFVFSFLRKHR